MRKRFLPALLALMLFTACSNTNGSSTSSTPSEAAGPDVRTDVKFDEEVKEIPDAVYTMIFEPTPSAVTYLEMGMNIPEDVDTDWGAETETEANFTIFNTKPKKDFATVKIITAHPDIEQLVGSDDPKKIADYMAPNFFPAKDVHDALVKSSVEDFGYTLIRDWSGTLMGMSAHLVELVDPEEKMHKIRFYMCNDKMNAEFYSLEYRADISSSDTATIDNARNIVLSMKKF